MPLFNFIFAILAYWFLLTNGVLSVKPVIGDVLSGSYAEDAGLLYGDEIQKVGNKETLDWESVIIYILNDITSAGKVNLEVKNPAMGSRKSVIEIQEDSSSFTEPGEFFQSLGFYPWRPPAVVGSVYEGSPAERLGIRTGDKITSIDGEHVKTFDDLVNTVEKLIEPRLSGSSIFLDPTFIEPGEVSIILANEYFPLSSAAVRINGFIVDPGS